MAYETDVNTVHILSKEQRRQCIKNKLAYRLEEQYNIINQEHTNPRMVRPHIDLTHGESSNLDKCWGQIIDDYVPLYRSGDEFGIPNLLSSMFKASGGVLYKVVGGKYYRCEGSLVKRYVSIYVHKSARISQSIFLILHFSNHTVPTTFISKSKSFTKDGRREEAQD